MKSVRFPYCKIADMMYVLLQAFLGDPQELVFGEELNTEFILIECRYHSRVVLQEYAMGMFSYVCFLCKSRRFM